MEEEYLTSQEAMEFLKINRKSLYLLIYSGKLPNATKLLSQWRIPKSDCINLLKKIQR